ncbi:hypothetical protein P4U65_20150 [Bacillus pacificus]|nr:hypothetical protein [Bacillus pacificus]
MPIDLRIDTPRFDYDENGQVRTYTAANGTGSTFNYNQTGKLTDLVIGTWPSDR